MNDRQLREVGTLLRSARERRGLSQRELARISGVSDSTIRSIERAEKETETRPSTWIQLAKVLGQDGLRLLAMVGIEADVIRIDDAPSPAETDTGAQRLIYQGRPLTPDEEERVLAYIDGLRARETEE